MQSGLIHKAFLAIMLYVILMVSWKPGKETRETESQRTDRIKLEREKLFMLRDYKSAIIIRYQLHARYLEIYN